MTPRPRCGNDPRAQLTPGDRAAIANLHAYLAARTEEKTTVTDLDAARAALQPYEIVSGFTGHIEAFEAAVRANERAAAEARRLGAPDALSTTQAAMERGLLALLRVAEAYLSALHGSAARHENLGANLGCLGCELRDRIAVALRRLVAAEAQEMPFSAGMTEDEGDYAQPDPPIRCARLEPPEATS